MRNGLRGLSTFGLIVCAAAGIPSCGGAQTNTAGCAQQRWQGQCRLDAVTTIRTVERFPRSFVVLEAIYVPQASGGVTPSEVRQEFTVQALQEAAFRDHLSAHGIVPCTVEPAQGAACGQPVVQVALPAFQPPAAATARAAHRDCADLEEAEGRGESGVESAPALGERFRFDQGSAAVTPALQEAATAVARQMKNDPGIECVALAGNVAVGEPMTLAQERSRAVRDLLLSHGIDPSRITIFTTNVPTYAGTAPQERQVLPEHREVNVKIVLYGK